MSIIKANTFIVTNAEVGWVEYAAKLFFPNLTHILKNLKIISARQKYELKFPDDPLYWKINTFLEIKEMFNDNLLTNIISIGDSEVEMISAKILSKKYENSVYKTIKFQKNPLLEDLIKQMSMVKIKFETIFSMGINISLSLERKFETIY